MIAQPSAHGEARASAPPLRFAVLCSGERLEAWQTACLEQLLDVPGVELVSVWMPGDRESAAALDRRARAGSGRAFRAWQRWLGRCRGLEAARAPERVAALSPVRCAVALGADGRERVSAEVLERLAHGLDFIVDLCDLLGHADPARGPRHGIWCFRDGDALELRDGPPAFCEVYGGEPVVTRALVRLAGRERASVLRQGSWPTRHSYARTADTVLFGSARWPAQVAAQILAGSAAACGADPLPSLPVQRPAPGARRLLGFALRSGRQLVAEAARQLFRHEQWNVGLVRAPIASFLGAQRTPPIEWLEDPPAGEFRADPFGVLRDGELVILCESLRHRDGVGTIVSLRPGAASNRGAVPVGIGPPVHRSYPFLLEWEGDVYCVPETHQAREVALYRALAFPGEWSKVATLIEGVAAVDSTVFQHGGLWWLACADADADDRCELHLWYASALRGPWRPHARNPVKIDVRSARPGGTPFVHGGALYRPAQDCSRTYGGRVVIQRVTCLTPDAFAEEPAAAVEPDPRGRYPAGLHTLSAVGALTLLDGKRSVFHAAQFRRALWGIARSALGLAPGAGFPGAASEPER